MRSASELSRSPARKRTAEAVLVFGDLEDLGIGARAGAEVNCASGKVAAELGHVGIVAVEEGDAGLRQRGYQFELGAGDAGLPVGKTLNMRGADVGDHAPIGRGNPGQRGDLARVIHAHLDHGVLVLRLNAKNLERQAVSVVQVQYVAQYNADLANYRQVTLTAFQQVEDAMAGTRIYSQQILRQQQAVKDAEDYLNLEMVRYNTGVDPYVNVVIAQTTLLNTQETLNALQVEEMVSSVELVQALGGGWDRTQLPTPQQAGAKTTNAEYKLQQ